MIIAAILSSKGSEVATVSAGTSVRDAVSLLADRKIGAVPVVDGTCAKRIAKGGSWGTLGSNLRTAERFPYAPTHRDDSIGIRVAKTLR